MGRKKKSPPEARAREMRPEPRAAVALAPAPRDLARFFPAILASAIAIVYANSFAGVWLFDDRISILDNATIRSLWPIWRAFWGPDETGVSGRPFLNFTFALNHAISGYNIWSYHLVNLAIHIAAALALYGLIRRTLLLPSMRDRLAADSSALAFAVALLWGVHPIQTESVTYIIIRNESLMGMFYLLALYAFARAAGGSGADWRWGAASVAACYLGMASKETMVTAPLLIFLYDRCLPAGSFGEAIRRRGWLHAAIASAWILAAILIATGPRQVSTGFGMEGASPLKYFLIECGVLLRYLRLAFWPHPLVFDYGWALPGPPKGWLAPLLVCLALGAAALWALWRRPALGFLGAAVFIVLAPTTSFMPTVEPCWEYRMYLPLAAVLALALLAARRVMAMAFEALKIDPARRPAVSSAALAVVALLFGALTIARNLDYRSEIVLVEKSLARYPVNPRGLWNLGTQLLKSGDPDGAERALRRALEIHPNYADVWCTLGVAQIGQRKIAEAEASLKRAVELQPDYAKARSNLALVFLNTGRPQEALEQAELALKAKPDLQEAAIVRGEALKALGRPGEK